MFDLHISKFTWWTTRWIYPYMSHVHTSPQIMGVSTVFRFQIPTISNPNLSTVNINPDISNFNCYVPMFVLTLCPPNFRHFHLLYCGGTRCVSKGKTRQHWINGYSWRWGGNAGMGMVEWLQPEIDLRLWLWKELCRPFRLDYYDSCFFFSMFLVSSFGHPSRHWVFFLEVNTDLGRRWELFRMSTRTWFLGFRGGLGGWKSTHNKMFKGIQSINPSKWLDTPRKSHFWYASNMVDLWIIFRFSKILSQKWRL